MIGLDTNVLVRYIVQDNVEQWRVASQFVDNLHENAPGFISQITLAELVWVLTTIYELKRAEVAETLADLLQSRELVVDRADIVSQAVEAYASGKADFADYLIAHLDQASGCSGTVTFDRKAAKSAGMTLITPE